MNQRIDNPSDNAADDLAALYAVGAMSSEERTEFESRLEEDAELCKALSSYDAVSEALIDEIMPVEPEPAVRNSLLCRIETDTNVTAAHETSVTIHRAGADDWQDAGAPGVSMRVLHLDLEQQRMTALVRFEPGATFPSHVHDQDEECLVLEGDLDFGEYALGVGDYLRAAAGSTHGIARSRHGCVCLITMAMPDALVA